MSVSGHSSSGHREESGGRSRPKYPKPDPVPSTEKDKDPEFCNKATDRHDLVEYIEVVSYMPDVELSEEDFKYYNSCKADLRDMLLIYRGVRLRDIRNHFKRATLYDVDLERLKLKSWAHFLLTCVGMLDYKIVSQQDVDKEEVFAFLADKVKGDVNVVTKELQSMLNCTPVKDNEAPIPFKLVDIKPREAFMKGFLDVAEGHAKIDPRVPKQDLGVAAAGTLWKLKNHKLTFEEQINITNKIKKPLTVAETTAPIPSTRNGSLEDFFNSIVEGSENNQTAPPTDFPRPSWL